MHSSSLKISQICYSDENQIHINAIVLLIGYLIKYWFQHKWNELRNVCGNTLLLRLSISFVMLSLLSTSTSRSDRSAQQAKPTSAMSSHSVAAAAELSPELRVSSLHIVHWHPAASLITNDNDQSTTLLFSAPFRLSPKLLPRYAISCITYLPNTCL